MLRKVFTDFKRGNFVLIDNIKFEMSFMLLLLMLRLSNEGMLGKLFIDDIMLLSNTRYFNEENGNCTLKSL